MYIVQCTCILYITLRIEKCTLHIILYSVQCKSTYMYHVQCTLYMVHVCTFTLYTLQYNVQCTFFNAQCNVQNTCTLHNVRNCIPGGLWYSWHLRPEGRSRGQKCLILIIQYVIELEKMNLLQKMGG